MATTTVPQPLKWHGGKSYLASKIIALMPPHVHYVEPYFGGGAVLLEKDPEGVSEVVNDLNGQLTNFWVVLRSPTQFKKLERTCIFTEFGEDVWHRASARLASPAQDGIWNHRVRRAWAFFVACRQSRAGTFKDFATLSRTRTRRKMNEQASAWLTAVEGLPEVHARLKRVVILNRDALDVIRQQDDPKACFYLDPPYLHATRVSKDAYAHEMSEDQHAALLNVLEGIKGKFLLSGYPSDLYEAARARNGWHRVDFEIDNKAAGGEIKRKMTECVWMNYEPPVANGAK